MEIRRVRSPAPTRPMPCMATALLLGACLPATAHAACPQELAVYSQPQGDAAIDFRPAVNGGAEIGAFKLLLGQNGIVLDGSVMRHGEAPDRSYGLITHGCPEGDATGAELDACVVWRGIIYSAAADGEIAALPPQGTPAAERLILADFGTAVGASQLYQEGRLGDLPSDVFELSGCQE